LYAYDPRRLPVDLFEIDVASGARRRVREMALADTTGVDGGVSLDVTPDRAYAYSFQRFLDELYLIDGLD
jgi:hypothetical protein